MKRMKLIISCNSCYPLAIKQQMTRMSLIIREIRVIRYYKKSSRWLFVLHKLVSLCHTVIELTAAIHIYLCFNRLL